MLQYLGNVFHCVHILCILFCSGEDVYISLNGVCEELNIHLDLDSVLLKNTYISLDNVHTVSLTNTSEILLHYRWSTWSSPKDLNQSLRYMHTKQVHLLRVWL